MKRWTKWLVYFPLAMLLAWLISNIIIWCIFKGVWYL